MERELKSESRIKGFQALILAAGRGSRLGVSGHEVPKALLEIGRRRLIEHQIDTLADAGVGPVHIVVGYGAEEIREIVGMRASYVVNTRWEQTNSLYSFWLARNAVRGDLLVLNCDVLFAPEVIGRLLDRPGDAVAIDCSSGTGREQMKVKTIGGNLVGMSKDLPPEDVAGENVGILKLTAETASRAFERAGEMIDDGEEKSWVGAVITDIARENKIRAVDIGGLPWVEIDFAADLARARKEVWPAIEGGSYRRRRWWRVALGSISIATLVGALYLGASLQGPGAEPAAEWESFAIEELRPVRVDLGGYTQSWWLLDEGTAADVAVPSGETVRVESRLLDPTTDREPYVVEVLLDGERLDWFKLVTRPSGKAKHPEWVVGHKKRFKVDIPEDVESLQVRLIAPRDAQCLVRVRRLLPDAED